MPCRIHFVASALVFCLLSAMARSAPASDRYGFDLDIVLSPKAAATLAARHEGLYLFASYYGDPKPGATKYADEVGHIDLTRGSTSHTIPGHSGPVHFTGPELAAKRLAMIDGSVMINLNVASARKSSPHNLLSCDFIDGKLADVRKAPVALHCGLIEEHPATVVKP